MTAGKTSPSATTADDSKEAAVVRRYRQLTRVSPYLPELARELMNVRHVIDPKDGRVVRKAHPINFDACAELSPVVRKTIEEFDRTSVDCHAGMEPALIDWLLKAGRRVTLEGQRPEELPQVNQRWLYKESRAIDPEFLAFIRGNERGLIRYDDSKVDPARLVGQIAAAWPKVSILVPARGDREAKEFHGRLREWVPKAQLAVPSRRVTKWNRVTVCTGKAQRSPIQIEQREIYISLEPDELFNPGKLRAICDVEMAWDARLFGFLPFSKRPTPRTRLEMLGLFGWEECRVYRHGQIPRAVDACFVPITGGPPLDAGGRTFALKKQGIWQHPVRNRRIAKLARAIVAKDFAFLRENYPQLKPFDDTQLGGRAALLVDNFFQAEAILNLLPDVPLVDADTPPEVAMEPFPNVVKARKRDSTAAALVMAIERFPARGEIPATLIRADTLGAALPLPDEFRFRPEGFPWEAEGPLVIDFLDRQHPELRLASRRREQGYADSGFRVAGRAEKSPWERFLADRPIAVTAAPSTAKKGVR